MAYSDDLIDNSDDDKKLLQLVKLRFKQGEEADHKQRERERKALAFYANDQWDPAVRAARAGQSASGGLPPVPARPTLTINKLREPVRQVLNEERQSDMGIEIVAADDFEDVSGPIDPTEIKLREGLVRRIQRQSEAQDARTWAFARAVIAGRGYYRVMTRYLPGKTMDQEVCVQRLYDQSSVMLDPSHEQPDGSDADWGIIGSDVPWEQYKAEYPHAEDGHPNSLCSYSDEDFRALGETEPDWFSQEGDLRMCRVIEYWYTERTTRTLVDLPDGPQWKDELPEGTVIPKGVQSREVVEKAIKWCKLDGCQVLERTDWPAPDMPIVKVLGEEIQPYDNERRAQGMVEPAIDAQVGFNAMVSKWVETIALAPIPPFQAAPGQVEPFKAWYEAANTRTLPYLPYEPIAVGGAVLGPPTRTPVDTPIQAIAGSLQMFSEGVATTTGVDSQLAHLGHADPSLKSGKAIQALQAQSQHGTSGFLDNLKRSIRYEGQITNNLLYPIYGKPGRLVRIVTGEGDSETVTIAPPAPQSPQGQNPDNGIGQPPQLGQPPMQGQQPQYRLTKDAHYNVIIKVTRSFDSRREQETNILGEILSAQPQMMAVFGDLFFKYQDGPGHQEMAERAKAMLDPKVLQAISQKDGQQIPPAAQAQIQAMQQQLQQLHQIATEQQKDLDTKRADNETKVLIAKAEIDSKERIAAADRETKLAVAELGAKVDRMGLFLDERTRVGLQLSDQAHEHVQSEQQRQHDAQQAALGMAHEAATGQVSQDAAAQSQQAEHAHQDATQAGSQAHEADMAEQAAAQAADQEQGT